MIGVLDPMLFDWPGSESLSPADEKEFTAAIRAVVHAARLHKIRISLGGDYGSKLLSDFIQPLEQRLTSQNAKSILAELRKLALPRSEWAAAPATTRVWGFRTLFGPSVLPAAWEDRMADAVARPVAAGVAVVVFVRLLDGRNLRKHRGKKHVVIDEVTRWRLYVRVPGAPRHVGVDCVRSRTQIERPWTIRLDPRLPTERDGARYPFCLPINWHRGQCVLVRTMSSVPVWVDDAERGWTRPNIPNGAGYHWDVFFEEPTLVAKVGVDQLNIVEVGAPEKEGTHGALHHVPSKKKSKVTDTGWSCA